MSNAQKINELTKEQILKIIPNVQNMVQLCAEFNISLNFHSRNKLKQKFKELGIEDDISFLRKTHCYTLQDLIDATNQSNTYSDICRLLGITVCTGNFKNIQERHKQHGIVFHNKINANLAQVKSPLQDIEKSELEKVVNESYCVKDVLMLLNIPIQSHNYKKLLQKITIYEIDISHFNVSHTMRRNKFAWDPDVLLIQNSLATRSTLLRYMKNNHYTGTCSECGIGEIYNNKFLRLELDHINGDSSDNRLENLRWLCPNCHSQTPTFKIGNKKGKTKPSLNPKSNNI